MTAVAQVLVSGDYGATFGTTQSIGTSPGVLGGFDTTRSSQTSYAAMAAKVRKATIIGGAYSDHSTFTGANPVCLIIPYYRRNSATTKQTNASDPDYIVALDTPDSGGGTLYWVAGATATKTDITPESGVTFSNANCITASYGTYIAVFGNKAGLVYLWVSVNGGTSWTRITTLTLPGFIRGRRGDNSALRNRGQLYIAHNSALYYSSRWARAGIKVRNQPAPSANGFDIWG